LFGDTTKNCSLLLLALDVVIPKGAESKPFRKVLILSGGELRFSAGLAMLATLHQRGWFPDVTSTLRILQDPGRVLKLTHQLQPGQPNPAKWYEAALSDEYFRIMRRVKVNKDFFSRVWIKTETRLRACFTANDFPDRRNAIEEGSTRQASFPFFLPY